jgi:hypothetical protein
VVVSVEVAAVELVGADSAVDEFVVAAESVVAVTPFGALIAAVVANLGGALVVPAIPAGAFQPVFGVLIADEPVPGVAAPMVFGFPEFLSMPAAGSARPVVGPVFARGIVDFPVLQRTSIWITHLVVP